MRVPTARVHSSGARFSRRLLLCSVRGETGQSHRWCGPHGVSRSLGDLGLGPARVLRTDAQFVHEDHSALSRHTPFRLGLFDILFYLLPLVGATLIATGFVVKGDRRPSHLLIAALAGVIIVVVVRKWSPGYL